MRRFLISTRVRGAQEGSERRETSKTLKPSRPRVYVRPAYAGNWDAIKINEGTCEQRDLALVSTLAECKEAALQLRGTAEVLKRRDRRWPYCSMQNGTIYFDPTGMEKKRRARLLNNEPGDDPEYYGLCKKGTAHTAATPALKPP